MPAIATPILMVLANKTSKELLDREGKEQLAQEIMREAVRPMGIEIALPEPVTAAAGDASPQRRPTSAGASAPPRATMQAEAALRRDAAQPDPARSLLELHHS